MSQETEFEKLVEQYYPSLYRFAYSLTRQESEACDLTQETYLIWARKGHQVRDESKVKSWLFTTLHREYLQKHRRRIRFPHVELDTAEEELPVMPPISLERVDRPNLLEALSKLDPNFHAAVALFYLEDHSYPEIAEILQVPLGTVKSRISRGIAQLHALLSESPIGKEVARG